MNNCDRCGCNEVKVHLTMDESSKHLCNDCYNELMSDELEVELEPLIETFSLKDYQGISLTFNVERRLHPMGIYLEAAENIEFGYRFAVHGELDCNQHELFYSLINKTRKGISLQHVDKGVFPNGQTYNSILNDQIKGLIEYDETSNGTPLIIIDGKPFTWEEVGKMLMSYEGFQIMVKLCELSDDMD